MRMESVTTGRATTSAQQVVSVTTSSGTFLLAAPRRVALIVSAPLTNRFTLSLKSTAVIDEGLTLHPTQDPLLLTVEKHGDLVTRGWTAISSSGTQGVAVIEVFSAV